MKRIITILLSVMLILSLSACGSSEKEPATNTDNNQTAVNTNDASKVDPAFAKVMSTSTDGEYLVVTVSEDAGIMDESAWVGLVPAGTYYALEKDADEADVYYVYAEIREEGKPYVFRCNFAEVADGEYSLILTSSDNGDVGYVIAQVAVEKKGSDLTFNYEKSTVNSAPAPAASDTEGSTGEEAYVPENLEVGVEDLGEDFKMVIKNETPVGEVLVEALYDYNGDTLEKVLFNYYLPDASMVNELVEYIKEDAVDPDSISVNGNVISCEMADKDVADLASVPRDMLISAFNAIEQ